VNGVEAKSTQGEPFIYEGRTYVPLRAVAEALGTEVTWDGQANRVHINGKVNLDGQVYIKTVTARPLSDKWGYTTVIYTVMLINATDRNLSGLSLTCKGLSKEGRLLDTVARNVQGEVKAHTTQALEFSGDAAQIAPAPTELTGMCELGTPMG
jgi:hypothetical protein